MRGFSPMISRAELVSTDDGSGEQTVNLRGMAGESFTNIYRHQPFGLAAHAPQGSSGLLLAMGGERSKAVLIGAESPGKRPTGLPEGTSVLYDSSGNVIFAKAASGIQVKAKSGKIVVEAAPGQKVYLGGDPADGGTFGRVGTDAGVSTIVYAKV